VSNNKAAALQKQNKNINQVRDSLDKGGKTLLSYVFFL
jgi:hypothetical protein